MFTIKTYLSAISYLTICLLSIYITHKIDDVKSLTLANKQLKIENTELKKDNAYQLYLLDLSESSNKMLMDEKNTISAEYEYATQNIIKYQNIINKLPITDNSVLLFLKQSETTANAIHNIASIAIGNTSNSGCTTSGILLYIDALREYGAICKEQLNSCIDFYNNIRNKQS